MDPIVENARTDLLKLDASQEILSDADKQSEEENAAFSDVKNLISPGGLHEIQASVDNALQLHASLLTLIAKKFHPSARTEGRLNFLMGNGSLNHSIFYLCHGVLPAIARFASKKYFEATCDVRAVEDCAFDIDEFFDQVEIPTIQELNEVMKELAIISGLNACSYPGGMDSATELFRQQGLVYHYANARPIYSRLGVLTMVQNATTSDKSAILYRDSQSIDCGSHCLPQDKTVEEVHRLMRLSLPTRGHNEVSYLEELRALSLLGPISEVGPLAQMGRRSAFDVTGKAPHGSFEIFSSVALKLEAALQESFPFKFDKHSLSDDTITFKDLNGDTHLASSLISISGNQLDEHKLDIQRVGAAVGWIDVRKIVFGQPDDIGDLGIAGPGDVQATAFSFETANGFPRPRIPALFTKEVDGKVMEKRLKEQMKAKEEVDVSAAFKGAKQLLKGVVQRYQKKAVETTLEITKPKLMQKVGSSNYSDLVKLTCEWRKEYSSWCEALDFDVNGVPQLPSDDGGASMKPMLMQQILRHPKSSTLEAIERQKLKVSKINMRFIAGSGLRGGSHCNSSGVSTVTSSSEVLHILDSYIKGDDMNPEADLRHGRKVRTSVGGGIHSWKKAGLLEKVIQVRDLFKDARIPDAATFDQQRQMKYLKERKEKDSMYLLQRRRAEEANQEEVQMTQPSFWSSAVGVPVAAREECDQFIHRIRASAETRPSRVSHIRVRKARTKSVCKWRESESAPVCGLEFRTKIELSMHQKANEGAHRIFICQSVNREGGGNKCGSCFCNFEEFREHKAIHANARKEIRILKNRK